MNPSPVFYRVTFMGFHGYGRKISVDVLASDVADGLDCARLSTKAVGGEAAKIERMSPRWMDSDAEASPDMISESALRHYADMIGFDLVKKEKA